MELSSSWETRFLDEIDQAEAARLVGNEGKARVCARRAAAIIVREALRRQGITIVDPSAYVQLRYFHELPHLPAHTREIISHFLVRITTDGNLPIEADLIDEARWLARELLSNPGSSQLTP